MQPREKNKPLKLPRVCKNSRRLYNSCTAVSLTSQTCRRPTAAETLEGQLPKSVKVFLFLKTGEGATQPHGVRSSKRQEKMTLHRGLKQRWRRVICSAGVFTPPSSRSAQSDGAADHSSSAKVETLGLIRNICRRGRKGRRRLASTYVESFPPEQGSVAPSSTTSSSSSSRLFSQTAETCAVSRMENSILKLTGAIRHLTRALWRPADVQTHTQQMCNISATNHIRNF